MIAARARLLRSVLAALSAASLAACGELSSGLGDEVFGYVEDASFESKADAGSITFRVASGGYDYGLPTAKLQTETRKLFKTAAAFRTYFGGATPPNVDWTKEWAVFYTPGSPNLVRGSWATVRSVKLSSTGATLTVTTRHLKPGNCTPDRGRPFVIVAFAKPRPSPTSTRFVKDDYTRSCAATTAAITASRFATDLKAHLSIWYSTHAVDVSASGGRSLSAAQAAVRSSSVREVTDAEDDPDGHDLTKVRVFRHADVVWPGSDIVWFGAYDKASGQKLAIYDFN